MDELESTDRKTVSETAAYLRQVADQLAGDGALTLDLQSRRVTLRPTDPITFEQAVESDWTVGGDEARQRLEFELGWWRDAATADSGILDVETRGRDDPSERT